jgi:hypothetical protein
MPHAARMGIAGHDGDSDAVHRLSEVMIVLSRSRRVEDNAPYQRMFQSAYGAARSA